MSSVLKSVSALLVAGALAVVGVSFLWSTLTIRDLLTENRRLREALSNLTREEQIGYAKVLGQEQRDGKLFTRLRLVQTARDNPLERVGQYDIEVEGDVVHFDALVVKFDNRLVQSGDERALFLWRRVYGEHQAPADGFSIEEPGVPAARYREVFAPLKLEEELMFWDAIWSLATDPTRLQEYGVRATYGSVVYTRLRPGLIYAFKITATGQLYPEVVPDL